MSDMAFAAAIWPNQYGSSTGGVMKSTVLMNARSGATRYTAASSLVSNPTSRFGSSDGLRYFSASETTVGPILAAQPQVRDNPVSVLFFLKNIKTYLILFVYTSWH